MIGFGSFQHMFTLKLDLRSSNSINPGRIRLSKRRLQPGPGPALLIKTETGTLSGGDQPQHYQCLGRIAAITVGLTGHQLKQADKAGRYARRNESVRGPGRFVQPVHQSSSEYPGVAPLITLTAKRTDKPVWPQGIRHFYFACENAYNRPALNKLKGIQA